MGKTGEKSRSISSAKAVQEAKHSGGKWDERLAYMQLNRWRVASTVNIFTQYQMGMLPDGTFEQVFPSITRLYENCLLKPIINLYATPDYQEFLTTLDNPCDE